MCLLVLFLNSCEHVPLPLFPHPVSLLLTGSQGGLGKEPMTSRSKKKVPANGGARPIVDDDMSEDDEAEEIMPARTTKRTRTGDASKKSVVKKAPRKPFHKWKPEAYQEYREDNPYDEERASRGNPHFYNTDQELVYKEIYINKDYSVIPQHTIDINFLQLPKNKEYFAETLAICEEFGLIPLM